jgi:uncharacterized cofD-like protein
MKKIVAIGGGTGLSTLLRGLKEYPLKLSAVVAVTDEGGSSGQLRKELGIIPPGDIRNCLVALSKEESLMARLLQYRFRGSGSLGGHSFGNIFLAALANLSGGFGRGVAEAGKVLSIKGDVMPVTLSDVRLEAELADGRCIRGERRISSLAPGEKIKNIYLVGKNIRLQPMAAAAVMAADYVILGPGSLYTSIVTNLLVPGMALCLKKSRAKKIYVSNIMTQPGETDGYTMSDHVNVVRDHAGVDFDYILTDRSKLDPKVLARYSVRGAHPVIDDLATGYSGGAEMVGARFVSTSHYARHDPAKLALALMRIISRKRRY